MGSRAFRFIFLTILLTYSGCAARAQGYGFASPPVEIFRDGPLVEQVWELDDRDAGWLNALDPPPTPAVARFREAIRTRVGDVNPFTILEREEARWTGSADPVEQQELRNTQRVKKRQVGVIRKLSGLEMALLDAQLARVPDMAEKPAEFQAFVLRHGPRWRIYFVASDTPYPPKPVHVLPAVQKDVSSGWTLAEHVHVHTFEQGGGRNVGLGTPAPSSNDVQFYRMLADEYGLERAAVTNGFDTIEVQASELGKLEARE